MTASLAYRKNEPAIWRGELPEKYLRILPHIPGERVLEMGSAEGVLAMLMAQAGKNVFALEANPSRHADALRLHKEWLSRGFLPSSARIEFVCGRAEWATIPGAFDTLVAVRMIYYLREHLDTVFAAFSGIPNIVLCGNRNRADNWRRGTPHAPLGEFNRYAALEGMRDLLERHGYTIEHEVTDGDEIVVGRCCDAA